MANYAEYEFYATGDPLALQLLTNSLPIADGPEQDIFYDENGEVIIYYRCICKWSLDNYCTPLSNAQCAPWDIDSLSNEDAEREDLLKKLYRMPMVQKSKVLQLKIQLHEWSSESDFEYFVIYDHGKKLSIDETFWKKLRSAGYNRIFWCKNYDSSIRWGSYAGLISMDSSEEKRNIEAPPLWFKDDFPDYQEFCKVFDINPKVLEESMWEQIDENTYACKKNF